MSIPEFTFEQTAILLALAHLTGWSADRISLKIKEVTKKALTAEEVWMVHGRWVLDRKTGEQLSVDERELMEMLLKGIDVQVTGSMKPLSQTVQPVYVFNVCFGERQLTCIVQTSVTFTPGWSDKVSPEDSSNTIKTL